MSKMFESIKKIIKEHLKFFIIFILLTVLLVILDQATKWLAVYYLGPLNVIEVNELPTQRGSSVEVIPNLMNFTLITNNGAAFGIGSGKLYMRIIFILISWIGFILIPIYILYLFLRKKDPITKLKVPYYISALLIYSGTIGNLIDRTFYWDNPCGVIDFIDITPLISNFGIFNLADSFVVVGVFLLLIILIIESFVDNKENEENEEKN